MSTPVILCSTIGLTLEPIYFDPRASHPACRSTSRLNGLYAAGNSDRRITERVASHPDSIGAKKPSELMTCSRDSVSLTIRTESMSWRASSEIAVSTDATVRNGDVGFRRTQISGIGMPRGGRFFARSARMDSSMAVSCDASAPRRYGHSAPYRRAISRYCSESVLTINLSNAIFLAKAMEYASRGCPAIGRMFLFGTPFEPDLAGMSA